MASDPELKSSLHITRAQTCIQLPKCLRSSFRILEKFFCAVHNALPFLQCECFGCKVITASIEALFGDRGIEFQKVLHLSIVSSERRTKG